LNQFVGSGGTVCVLDVRRSKLIVPTVSGGGLLPIVDAELAYIAALWPNV
jgi:hypothetical protein